jgi:hypothetical protein
VISLLNLVELLHFGSMSSEASNTNNSDKEGSESPMALANKSSYYYAHKQVRLLFIIRYLGIAFSMQFTAKLETNECSVRRLQQSSKHL